MLPNIQQLVTHNQRFHCDDVFAYAILGTLFPHATLLRTRNIDMGMLIDPNVLIFDVGNQCDPNLNNYDHHQRNAGARPNGIPYAAFGLIWKFFGRDYIRTICPEHVERVWDDIDRNIVSFIDGMDNGYLDLKACTAPAPLQEPLYPLTFNSIVDAYNPREDGASDEMFFAQFLQVREIAQTFLTSSVRQSHSQIAAEVYFQEHVKPGDAYIELPCYFAWQAAAMTYPDLKFVIIPRPISRDFVAIQVPNSASSMQGRASFPAAWRGLQKGALQAACGEPSAEFCHATGFMLVAHDREALIRLIKRAV